MALTEITKVTGPGIHTLSNILSHNINSSGIITATEFDGKFSGNIVGTAATFSGNVTIGGTLTYEDVTNIDSVGLITARNGIKVGTGITFETNGQATFSGITTSRGYEVNGYSDGAATYNYVKVGRLKIFDNGSNNHIFNGYAAPIYLQGSALRLLGNDIFLYNTASSRYYFRGQNLGAASLYWAGSNNHGVKLATSEKGITVGSGVTIETNGQATYTGIITASTGFRVPDGNYNTNLIGIGNQEDFIIYHDTAHTYAENKVGDFRLKADTIKIQSRTGVENFIQATYNGSVELFYNGSKKFETTHMGGVLSGILTATTFDGNLSGGTVAGSTGTFSGDVDVDGHTNLDNVSIAGVTTISHTGANQLVIKDSDTSGDAAHMRISFQDSGGTEKFFVGNNNNNGWLYLGSPSGQNNNIAFRVNGSDKFQINAAGAYVNGDLTVNGTVDILDSIIHTGDTNTKIRFPANDTIAFEVGVTGEVARFLPTSAGSGGPRMGLGTNNPTGMLHIYGSNPPFRIQNSNDSANLQIGMWDTSNVMFQVSHRPFKLATETSHPIVFHTGGLNNEKLRITSSGTVNIGGDYTSTTSRLRINSTSYPETTEYLAVFKAGVENGNRFKNRYIKIRNNYTGSVHGGVPIVWESNADNSNNKGYGAVVTEGNGDIRFLNAAATSEKAIGTDLLGTISEKLRIKSNGNVRIANTTTSPTGDFRMLTLIARSDKQASIGFAQASGVYSGATATGGYSIRLGVDAALELSTHNSNLVALKATQTGNVEMVGDLKTNNLSGRNIVINGDMRVAQRATSASMSNHGNDIPVCDRWNYNRNGPTATVAQVAEAPDASGFKYSLKWTNTSPVGSIAAGNALFFNYIVETQDIQRLGYGHSNGKKATLSFYAKGSLSGKIGMSCTRDGRIFSANVDMTANTWQHHSIVIPADTSTAFQANDNAQGFTFRFCWGAGSNATSGATNNWINFHNAYTAGFTAGQQGAYLTTNGSTFQITGVQLEIGSQSTPFEFIDYDDQLKMCQRYYAIFHPCTQAQIYIESGGTNTHSFWEAPVPAGMRTEPSVYLLGTWTGHTMAGGKTISAVALQGIDNGGNAGTPHPGSMGAVSLRVTRNSGGTYNDRDVVHHDGWGNGNAWIGYDAEF